MVNSLVLTNERTGAIITIDRTGTTSYVLDELVIDNPDIQAETYRVPQQIGESYAGDTVGTRGVSISGYVIAKFDEDENVLGMSWETYYTQQKTKIESAKDVLNKLVMIRDTIRVVIGDRYLETKPEGVVMYSTKEKENNEVLCQFEISLVSYDPLFKKVSGSGMWVNSVEKKFKFPMILLEQATLFGIRSPGARTVQIVSNADETIGFKLTLSFYADFDDGFEFQITNVTTGEKLMFKVPSGYEIKNGDYIVIDTKVGEEDLRYHVASSGAETSIIATLVLGETTTSLPKIQNGVNYLAFSTLENLNAKLEYDEGVYNLKEL